MSDPQNTVLETLEGRNIRRDLQKMSILNYVDLKRRLVIMQQNMTSDHSCGYGKHIKVLS